MIHEHERLELAAAVLDFTLTDDELGELREALEDCPVCAERAQAYRRHAERLAELPILTAPEETLRAALAAARPGRPARASSTAWLLAAALLIAALLAVAAAAAGAFNSRPFLADASVPLPLSSRSDAVTAVNSTSPSPSPSESENPGDASAPAAAGPAFAANSIVEVTSPNLRVRSEPRVRSDSVKFEPLLLTGDQLFVIGGPVVDDGYEWYEVASWRASDPNRSLPTGWVARADHDGTPWIAKSPTSCPDPASIDAILAVDARQVLSCFGRRPLRFDAVVGGGSTINGCEFRAADGGCVVGPSWLTSTVRSALGRGVAGRTLGLTFDPSGAVGIGDTAIGSESTIEGAFDHVAAADCRSDGNRADLAVTKDDAILRCRSRFVVTKITIHEPAIAVDRPAVTTTDGLRVRSLPRVDASSTRYEPLLPAGTRLFVVEGPVPGSGYTWYRVVVPGILTTDGEPMAGWVAAESKTGEPWLGGVSLECPKTDQIVPLADLVRLASGTAPDGGLACFGGSTFTTRADVHADCNGPSTPGVGGWLDSPGPILVMTDRAATFVGRLPPELESMCTVPQDANWNLEGHFDDPAASGCSASAATVPASLAAVYRCRTTFVVTMTLRNG